MSFPQVIFKCVKPEYERRWGGEVGAEYWWIDDPCHDKNANWPTEWDLVGDVGPDKNLGEGGPVEYAWGELPDDEIIGVEPGVNFLGMYCVIENW